MVFRTAANGNVRRVRARLSARINLLHKNRECFIITTHDERRRGAESGAALWVYFHVKYILRKLFLSRILCIANNIAPNAKRLMCLLGRDNGLAAIRRTCESTRAHTHAHTLKPIGDSSYMCSLLAHSALGPPTGAPRVKCSRIMHAPALTTLGAPRPPAVARSRTQKVGFTCSLAGSTANIPEAIALWDALSRLIAGLKSMGVSDCSVPVVFYTP